MPTLEDTKDFPVTTLSDLLEADARGGIAAGADEDKYRRWAFLSTGAAGVLAIILAVVLITGGGDGGGDGGSSGEVVERPPGTQPVAFTVSGQLSSDIRPESIVSIIGEGGAVIASGGTVLRITEGREILGRTSKDIEIAVAQDEAPIVLAAIADDIPLQVQSGTLPKTTPTTEAPVAETPAPAGEPVPIEPGPAPPG